MRFDLTDLRLFLNVQEAGTITQGAHLTHMTLASASERIRGMEEALGTPLLLRDPRGVRLTPAGRTLAHHARLVHLQIERLQGELGEHGAGFKGRVRLMCNTSALSEHLPEALSRFLAQHPGISVDLEERTSPEVADALRDGLCDVGVLSDATDIDDLECQPFRADPLVLAVPRGHPFAARGEIALADAVDCPFIGLAEGSALQAHVAQQARRLGRRLNYRVRLRGLESVCRMVGLGVGVAIVPRTVAVRCARSARIQRVALSDPWASRSLVIATRRHDPPPLHTQQLVQHLLAR